MAPCTDTAKPTASTAMDSVQPFGQAISTALSSSPSTPVGAVLRQDLRQEVREIRTLRSVGTGGGRPPSVTRSGRR